MFVVGQKVYCTTFGEGVVTKVDDDDVEEIYPVDVEFVSGRWNCYTEDGKLYVDDNEPRLTVIEE